MRTFLSLVAAAAVVPQLTIQQRFAGRLHFRSRAPPSLPRGPVFVGGPKSFTTSPGAIAATVVQFRIVKLLIFSDIHDDLQALEKLLATEADYYIAAGDLFTWGRGLDRCGEILKSRGERVYVLPGNHESAATGRRACAALRPQRFPRAHLEPGRMDHVAGLGYSNPTPFNTPGEYSEARDGRAPGAVRRPRAAGADLPRPPYGTALDRIRPGLHAGSTAVRDFLAANQPALLLLRPHPRGRRRRWNRSATHTPRTSASRAIC